MACAGLNSCAGSLAATEVALAIRLLRVEGSHLSSPLVTLRRAAVLLCAVVALLAAIQTFQGAEVALGQSDAGCEATELCSLGAGEGDILTASGRWTGEDCDSRFFTNRDAHTIASACWRAGRSELS